jgi:hypothetical protein
VLLSLRCFLALLLLSFLLGFHATQLSAVLPDCENCACKDVKCWWMSGFPAQGRGAADPTTMAPIDYGIQFLNIPKGAACSPGGITTAGTCDIYEYVKVDYTCTSQTLSYFEMTPVQQGGLTMPTGRPIATCKK